MIQQIVRILRTIVRYVRSAHIMSVRVWSRWKIHANAEKYLDVLWAVNQELRSKTKYGDLGEEADKELWAIRDLLHSECESRGISVYDWE